MAGLKSGFTVSVSYSCIWTNHPAPSSCLLFIFFLSWSINLISSHQSQWRILFPFYLYMQTYLPADAAAASTVWILEEKVPLDICLSPFFQAPSRPLTVALTTSGGQWVPGNLIPRISHIRLLHYRSIPIFNLTLVIKQLYSIAFIIYALFFLDLCITNSLLFNYSFFLQFTVRFWGRKSNIFEPRKNLKCLFPLYWHFLFFLLIFKKGTFIFSCRGDAGRKKAGKRGG